MPDLRAEKVMEQMPKADATAHFAEYTEFTRCHPGSAGITWVVTAYCAERGDYGQSKERQSYDDRRPVCGNQGAAWRLLLD